jgi:threonine/homoserine/homoserine lactone efflux protein
VVQGFAFLAVFAMTVAPLRRWRAPPSFTRGLHLTGGGLFTLLAARLVLTERS